MSLKRIRMELARSHNHPMGSNRHGYELTVPLNANGFIDQHEFSRVPDACTVVRFWEGERDEHGTLIRKGQGWAFSYAPGEDDDELGFRLESHAMKVGEYLSVKGHDGRDHTFRIVFVREAPVASKST
jgi:hypothetical protein